MMLELRNVETFYDKVKVLNGLSLQLEAGTITGIIGNNGAGKSTTLNTIMGLIDDQPDKGSIHFEGRPIQRLNTEAIVARGIGYVPEGREVFPELSVYDNLRAGAWLQRSATSIRRRLEEMLVLFPALASRQKQQAGTLSGGEQQMLAIARALMNHPRLLILDEPSLGLAPLLIADIFRLIAEINRQGTTVLLVEQNARMTFAIADYVHILENGRFVQSGLASELQRNEDVMEFYLGESVSENIKGYQRFKRKRTWR